MYRNRETWRYKDLEYTLVMEAVISSSPYALFVPFSFLPAPLLKDSRSANENQKSGPGRWESECFTSFSMPENNDRRYSIDDDFARNVDVDGKCGGTNSDAIICRTVVFILFRTFHCVIPHSTHFRKYWHVYTYFGIHH
jgi:hypothetical protein